MNDAHLVDLGLIEYRQALAVQHALVERRLAGEIPDTLLLLEHPHVVTLGRRGTMADVLDSSLPVVEVERGGEATYHGPGQLVGYPIVALADRLEVKKYVHDLEEVLIRTSRAFGVAADRDPRQSGVWVGGKKLGSIGVAVRRNVTYHGFAHNVNTDLSYFAKIRPCGFDGSVMTSMERELGHPVSLGDFRKACATEFASVFGLRLESVPPGSVLPIPAT
ncbi:MAG: lipoyl(octanoyl) transferase LipB [Methanobacteriota archaeon]|nr:MAG: lipoyl(octanoyl) transferase LipB [Euryarchaeota archaeon]